MFADTPPLMNTVIWHRRKSEEFNVKVGIHQGSCLSPLLPITILEALSQELRSGSPWENLYADDLVIISE